MSLRTINSKAKVSILKQTNNQSLITTESTINNQFDNLLDTCKSTLLDLKKNNKEPFEYNKDDERLIKENQYIYDKYSETTLSKQFPSPNRLECVIKKIIPKKHKYQLEVNKKTMKYSNL